MSGHQTLEASLEALLTAEHLSGSNAVMCEACQQKTEATRQLRIAVAPPLLHVSLQRFVFDYQVGTQRSGHLESLTWEECTVLSTTFSIKYAVPSLPTLARSFPLQKMDRIKLNGPISIPLELDLDAILGATDLSGSGLPAAKRENKYRLVALMLHKGSTARSGHYGEAVLMIRVEI